MLARIIGTRHSLEYTLQLKESDATHLGTIKNIKEFVTHPDDIKRLTTGEAFVVNKSANRINRVNIRRSMIAC